MEEGKVINLGEDFFFFFFFFFCFSLLKTTEICNGNFLPGKSFHAGKKN